VAKRIIKTPQGHVVELDDTLQSIKITTTGGQTLTMDTQGIRIATADDTASLKMGVDGSITIQGSLSVTLKAPTISLEGTTIAVKADADASLESSGTCQIKGSLITIN
jgi:hypothetical protein